MRGVRVVYLVDGTADVRMVEGLAARFDLTLVAPAALGGRVSTGMLSASFRRALLSGRRLGFALRAARWLVANRRSYDVVIVLDNLLGALAANAARVIARRPVILQVGRPTEEYFRCKRRAGVIRGPRYLAGLLAVKALVRLNERLADAVAAVSGYVAAQSARRARRVAVVPAWGVDAGVFAPRCSPAEARLGLGLASERRPLILFRSRIAPEKDPVTFLEALAALRLAGRDVVALYVGAEHEEFTAIARRLRVPVVARDHVHPLEELPLYYRAADVNVQLSHAEGLGLSPLEALACETPTVVSAAGGLSEVADGGRAAAIVPPRAPANTATAIAWALDHAEEARTMARVGRRMVLARYTTEHAFAGWRALVDEVLGRTSPALETIAEGVAQGR